MEQSCLCPSLTRCCLSIGGHSSNCGTLAFASDEIWGLLHSSRSSEENTLLPKVFLWMQAARPRSTYLVTDRKTEVGAEQKVRVRWQD